MTVLAATWAAAACAAGAPVNVQTRSNTGAAAVAEGTSAETPMAVAGCYEVLRGPRCILRTGASLTAWVRAGSAAAVRVEVDGVAIEPALTRVQDGFRLVIAPARGAREVSVASDVPEALLVLPLAWIDEIAPLDPAEQARADGRTGEAEHLAEALAANGDPITAARATGLLARIAMRRGDLERGITLHERAIDLYRAADCLSGQYRDLTALAFAHTYRRRNYEAARRAIARAMALDDDGGEQRAVVPYYEAQLALETGDFARALSALERSLGACERLGLRRQARDARDSLAGALGRLGRHKEALRVLEQALAGADDADPCDRAENTQNLGWHQLNLARDDARAGRLATDAIATLEDAVAQFRASCADPLYLAAALTSLARAHVTRRDAVRARAALDEAVTLAPDTEVWSAFDRLELSARIATLTGRFDEAAQQLDRLDALAAEHELPLVAWRSQAERASSARAAGDTTRALEMYTRAEAAAVVVLGMVPLGDGRDDLATVLARAEREHVEILLELGRPEEAFAVARRNLGRSLRAFGAGSGASRLDPSQRARWEKAVGAYREARVALDQVLADEARLRHARETLAADALARVAAELTDLPSRSASARRAVKQALNEALGIQAEAQAPLAVPATKVGDGEVLLLFHRLRADWVGFAQTEASLVAKRIELPAEVSDLQAAALVTPFADQIRAAQRLIVLAVPPVDRVSIHGVELDGAPIGLEREVVYRLDVQHPARTPVRRAIVVAADPTHTLTEIFREGEEAAASLRAQGFEVTILSNGDATRARVVDLLGASEVGLFHYAGHAVVEGQDGWTSRLMLEDGTLTSADILTMATVPQRVVLSACSSAESSGASVPGLGIAQAFLVRGTQTVVASVRAVGDQRAYQTMQQVYATRSVFDPRSLSRAALDADRATESWRHFRVLDVWKGE